jgi:malonyl-CoA O-methyltransferase
MMKSPLIYSQAAELARSAAEDLLAQLPWMTLKPAVIVDVGCGIGEQSVALQRSYPKAAVFAMDINLPRLQYGQQVFSETAINWTAADGHRLPFKDHSVDLIFANFFLAWQPDISIIFREWLRVLRPEGLLMFNLFGPDTIKEYRDYLKDNWIPGIIDMHDAGDMLLSTGFADPVLAVENYTVKYKNIMQLVKELYESDLLISIPTNQQSNQPVSITFEIVSAHAFAPAEKIDQTEKTSTQSIPLAVLREQLGRN